MSLGLIKSGLFNHNNHVALLYDKLKTIIKNVGKLIFLIDFKPNGFN